MDLICKRLCPLCSWSKWAGPNTHRKLPSPGSKKLPNCFFFFYKNCFFFWISFCLVFPLFCLFSLIFIFLFFVQNARSFSNAMIVFIKINELFSNQWGFFKFDVFFIDELFKFDENFKIWWTSFSKTDELFSNLMLFFNFFFLTRWFCFQIRSIFCTTFRYIKTTNTLQLINAFG